MLSNVIHDTHRYSRASAIEPLNECTHTLFEFRNAESGVAKSIPQLAQLGADLVELRLGRTRRASVNHESAASLPDDHTSLVLEQTDSGLGRVQGDSVFSHKRSVRGQPIAHGEPPRVDLFAKHIRDASTRPGPPSSGRLVVHAAEPTGPVMRQRLTARATAAYSRRTDRLSQTVAAERHHNP